MKVFVATTCKPDDRKTLCTTRALAQAGARVTVGADRFLGQAFCSRYLSNKISYPHPRDNRAGFVDALKDHLRTEGCDVLLPMCDYTTIAIADRAEELGAFTRIPIPPLDILQIARNKAKTLEIASTLGIRVPRTHWAGDAEQLQAIAKTMSYPCIVKFREGFGGLGLLVVEDEEGLVKNYTFTQKEEDYALIRSQPLIQEYISGEIHDVCLLFNRGKMRAALTQKRLRMYPGRGGVGILNQTTQEPKLLDQAIRLLESLNWHGPAQVEFKVDAERGTVTLMEVNGRFWGTLDLSIRAGINFPLLACQMVMRGDISPVSNYQTGLCYRWTFPYGLLHFLEAGFKFRSLWDFVRMDKQMVSDFQLSDPLPPLAEAVFILRRLWAKIYYQKSPEISLR